LIHFYKRTEMRFRAKISEGVHIRRFDTIVSAIAKIAKTCVMRLTPDKIYLVMSEMGSIVGGPAVWGEMDQESLFNEYNMEGVSPEHNQIFVEFSPDTLHKNLTTLKSPSATALKMKLTKKGGAPNLTFEVTLSSNISNRQIVHDIPVQVIPRRRWSDYETPVLPPINISLALPDVKRLRLVLDKYRTLGSVVTVTAEKEGILSLKVESDDVTVTGHIKDLCAPLFKDNSRNPWRPDKDSEMDTASVRVDIKRLFTFLSAEAIMPERVLLNLADDAVLHLLLITQELVLQIYLPRTNK